MTPPKSLNELIESIHAEMGKEGLENADVNKVQALLNSYDANIGDWERYALKNEAGGCKYTRNLVDAGNGKFNLMVLVWDPKVSSPIHDHTNSHCLVKILDGELTERLYENPSDINQPLDMIKESTFEGNQVTYMHDKLGLHSMTNERSSHSVSLHLYSPPFDTCKTFCPKTGLARSSGNCVFYSVAGERQHYMDAIRDHLRTPSRPKCHTKRNAV
ncbi:hypothetical protein HDV02_006260 [Globomyces sp. JEL0801]|nr:hypothetical protein HDV02_006260 [Globomyces sp. JEL0801]